MEHLTLSRSYSTFLLKRKVAKEIPADEKLTERLPHSLKELNSGPKKGPQTEILSGRSLVRLSGTSIFRMPEDTQLT